MDRPTVMRTFPPLMRGRIKTPCTAENKLGVMSFFFHFFFTSEEFVPVDLLRLQSGFNDLTMWFFNIRFCSHATQIHTKCWEAAGEEIHVARTDCRADDTMAAEVRESSRCFENSDPPNYALIPQSVFSDSGGKLNPSQKTPVSLCTKVRKSCI